VKKSYLLVAALLAATSCWAWGWGNAPVVEGAARLDGGGQPGAWKGQEHMPAPRPAEGGGVEFLCPFTVANRAYWDHAVSANLADATCLELDLACDHPAALHSLTIYLKSGKGLYVGAASLTGAGRQRVILPRSAFTAEDRPAGWQQIEGIRFSPWRGQSNDVRIVLYSICARLGGVVVVQGTTSVGGPAERKMAQRATKMLTGWLATLGIGHNVVTDDDAAEALKHANVAILPYNSQPRSGEARALAALLARGGKLMVCYGADDSLARQMHFKLGAYQRTEVPGRWSSFSFAEAAAWKVPPRVFQESSNILPALPADDTAHVIAWWENSAGRRASVPAWTASAQGVWFAHVLQDEDLANKQRMLLGLLGTLDPAIWPQAAAQAYYRAGCVVGSSSFAATRAQLGALPEAENIYAGLPALFAARRYMEAVDQCRALDHAIAVAYASAQTPRRGELRGVWEHSGLGLYPGDWPRTCRELAAGRINTLFANMLWGGVAHFPSAALPPSFSSARYGDQLAAALTAAHANGLQFHCWAVCWNPGNAPDDFIKQLRRAGRLQETADGKSTPWLSPSHPDNVALLLNAYEDLVRRYPVDGLHLDYIRYSDRSVDYSAAARRAFEAWRGSAARGWPASCARGGAHAAEFERFRCETITAFVRQVSQRVRAVRPGIKLSAAVFAGYPECVGSVGQDWPVWLKNGYVDFVCPMNYTDDTNLFLARTAQHLALPGAAGRIYPGIGIASMECRLRPDQAIAQIVGLRQLGTPGYVFFDLGHPLRDEILPYLRLGVMKE
jgi:uncharacterized lipoprotein YddW (UPF0748 family)